MYEQSLVICQTVAQNTEFKLHTDRNLANM